MITELEILNFKSIELENFEFGALTVLTGQNSTGKSSVIQSILLACQYGFRENFYSMEELTQPFSDFSKIRNKYVNAKKISVKMGFISVSVDETSHGEVSFSNEDGTLNHQAIDRNDLSYEKQLGSSNTSTALFYLSANRVGQESIAAFSKSKTVGLNGEYLLSTFERLKSEPIFEELCVDSNSLTLSYQLNYWLSKITGVKSALKTENLAGSNVKVTFESNGLSDIEPINLGAGFSYLAKILIICLIAKPNDVVIIENPEVHLHPKSQALLGAFFSFLSNAGIQLIIETHCEHLINNIRYQVSQDNMPSENIVVYYKDSNRKPFEKILINDFGHFENEQHDRISFPSGFFDQSVQNLLSLR